MKTAYIVDIVRTPIGKYAGALASVRPDDLAAHVLKALISRNPTFQPDDLEDVIMGAANQSGEDNRNVARMAALLAGLPLHTGGLTVNRLCASGLQAIMDAARGLMLGEGQAYIAAGVESMTRAPFVMPKAATPFSRQPEIFDTTMGWRFINPRLSALHHPYTMGETAENVAKEFNISRLAQDEWAHLSQLRWKKAQEEGKFEAEIVPVSVASKKNGEQIFSTDEHPRLSSLEDLARLKPAFVEGGTVTAGNSSGINDGAAAGLLVSEETLKKYHLKPMARVVSMAVAGVSPHLMGMGPVPAVQKALSRAGLRLQDIDLVELNEAFAAQVLGCLQELGLNPEIVNVNGGSIAIGHPLGASGVRISATLLHEMQRREGVRYGLATMCIGVGQGAAIIYEKC
ncbi:acetyl-CoA C-acetyltransferase [Flexibacter flexilis DSM 6793]|uniref:Acetyl-CoA C-acetyltransferase n=1 Tax=Flexibacter flexilis DSM 6793 TaxID=927664 RepID=A0A1I1N7V5_9BACT|nr:acetyl-CoA C-acyltransferase [Flexibacter flexilis]SFC91558.1 acetyl-CoA C-acetyltransferase [Flexibacter flexilis DSM 6793]